MAEQTITFLDTLAAWVPILIALAALVYAVRSDVRGRRAAHEIQERAEQHDKVALRPYLCGFLKSHAPKPRASICVTNNGGGPAIVKRIWFQVDQSTDEHECSRPEVEKVLRFLGVGENHGYDVRGAMIGIGFGIGPGQEMQLLQVSYTGSDDPESESSAELIYDALTRIYFRMEYEDVFGETFVL